MMARDRLPIVRGVLYCTSAGLQHKELLANRELSIGTPEEQRALRKTTELIILSLFYRVPSLWSEGLPSSLCHSNRIERADNSSTTREDRDTYSFQQYGTRLKESGHGHIGPERKIMDNFYTL